MNMDSKEQRSFLRDEYLFLQGQYEDFDRRSMVIKGWIISGSIAGLALSIDKTYSVSIFVPIAMMIIAAMVWYLEAKWKLFQYALSDRIRIIEAYFRGDNDVLVKDPVPFQIYYFWFRSYSGDEPIYGYERNRPRSRTRRLLEAGLQQFVHLPYSVIIFLSLCALVTRITVR